MKYRPFGRLDWQVSALGFGAMRMPTTDSVPGSDQIDETEASRMIYRAIEGGVNYIDTAWPYHRQASEPFLGRALQGGWREKVRLATKLPQWLIEEPSQFDVYFDQQLERLQTDYIDFYLIHALDKKAWEKMAGFDVCAWAEKRIAEGRIRSLGFSFHDDYAAFQTIVDAYDWDFCQIQYNYMDVDNQAGVKGLRYAAGKGLAVIVMEPLLGGRLAVAPPDAVQQVWDGAPVQRTPADWALQWLWDQPEVSLVLSGMSTMQQVEENLASAAASGVSSLSPAELETVQQVREAFNGLCQIACTDCQYCQPCPSNINIPLMFELYNSGYMYGVVEHLREVYEKQIPAERRADQCARCRECEDKCPQHLPICDLLEDVDRVLGKRMPYPV